MGSSPCIFVPERCLESGVYVVVLGMNWNLTFVVTPMDWNLVCVCGILRDELESDLCILCVDWNLVCMVVLKAELESDFCMYNLEGWIANWPV